MEHPKAVGDRSTLAIMFALRAAGFDVLLPFGENTRYDLVIDDGHRLQRVQCKTGRLRGGAVRFATCSAYGHHRNPAIARRDYRGDVDSFAVYCAETGAVYVVPIDDLPVKTQASLRVTASRNNQKHGVRPAAQFQIAMVIAEIQGQRAGATAEPGATPGAPAPCA